MEQVRLILLISLSFLALLLWEAWQRDYAVHTSASSEIDNTPAQTAPAPSTLPNVPANATSIPQTPNATPTTANTSQLISVTTDTLKLDINLEGGVIERAALLDYPIDAATPEVPKLLLDNSSDRSFIEQSGLKAATDPGPDHYARYVTSATNYELSSGQQELRVDLSWENGQGIRVTKTYVFKRASHVVDVQYSVDNQSASPWRFRHYEQLQRKHVEQKQYFIHTFTGAALSTPEKRYAKFSFADLVDEPFNLDTKNGWVAILEHYFVAAVIPPRDDTYHYYSSTLPDGHYIVGLYGPELEVANGAKTTVDSQLYFGPKLQGTLAKIAPGLELTVDYGLLWFIGQILFWTLSKLHALLGNWGWAIIFLTCIVKLIFFPLSAAGYRSMAKMRKIQPRLLAIRDRYSNDRARLNQAMMDMYKEEKINPLGGCLPIIVQIPVFISLYWVILESVELRQAAWIGWITDLSTKDPWFVLPVLMTLSMWMQSKLNPAPLDPIQAKVMQIMPFAFGFFFAFFPSGLVLYWFVNNMLSIGQQWYITRAIEGAK